jgi:hypothetical protein
MTYAYDNTVYLRLTNDLFCFTLLLAESISLHVIFFRIRMYCCNLQKHSVTAALTRSVTRTTNFLPTGNTCNRCS